MTMICLQCHLPRNISNMVQRFDEVNGKRTRIGFVCKKCVLKDFKREAKRLKAGQPTLNLQTPLETGKELK